MKQWLPDYRLAPTAIRRLAALAGIGGLIGNGFGVALLGLPMLMIATPAQAADCTLTPATGSTTYTYTAANLASAATITFAAQMKCTTGNDGLSVCGGASFVLPSADNGANGIPMRFRFRDTTHSGAANNIASQAMYGAYGPGGTGASTSDVSVITVVQAGDAIGSPPGTYSRTFDFHIDMTGGATGSVCDPYGANGIDSATATYTANYVIPPVCTLVTTPAINFGTISSIGPTTARLDASGTIVTNCNGTYTIYIGDGGHRAAVGSGNRRMANGSSLLPYQLYKDSGRATVWDETGGTNATGGSGGVSGTGNSANQSTTVYASIAAGTALPSVTGTYQDTVVVTVTY